MNVAIRAKRILAAINNYQEANHKNNWSLSLTDTCLGDAIGCYRNPKPHDDVIGIFTKGLAWIDCGHEVILQFVDIADVSLSSGKESEGLLLRTQDGKYFHLPIRGQRGRFFDSMEILRFLDRVKLDIARRND